MSSPLKQNTTTIQELLNKINSLPEEVILPELTNPADASKALSGYEFINEDCEKVTGTIPTKTASNLTASGATVTVPAGYYATQATKSVTTTTQATPSVSIDANGKITATATQTAGYVSAGTKTGTKQLTTQAAKTITPSTSSQTAVASGVYTTGAVTVAAIPSTYVKPNSTKAATTYTPTTTNQTIAAGTYCSGAQTIKGDSNLKAENIKSGVSIFGVAGSLEAGGSGGGSVEAYTAEISYNNIPVFIWRDGCWGITSLLGEQLIPYGIAFFIDDSGHCTWDIHGGGAIVTEIYGLMTGMPIGFMCKFTEDGGYIKIFEEDIYDDDEGGGGI